MLRRLCIPLIALVLAACSTEQQIVAPAAVGERLLLAYLGGDNNLSGEATAKLEALRAGWGGPCGGGVVAYLDQPGGAQLVEFVEKSAAHPQGLKTVEVYNVENSASATVFARVIRDVKARYTPRHYNLLVFSHASGWLPEGRLARPAQPGDEDLIAALPTTYGGIAARSFIMDGRDEMELADMAAAIPDHTFDCIIFETCFSAGIEVAWELRDKADYILASSAEIVSPGYTATYASDTYLLTSGNPGAFGRAVFDEVLTYAEGDALRSATYSLIKTSGLEPLAEFLGVNCNAADQGSYGGVQHFDRNLGTGAYLFFDFGDYYSRLLETDAQRAQFTALLAACVEWKAATATFLPAYGGFNVTHHSGLTCYIPQSGLPYLNARYDRLGWAKAIAR